MCHFFPGFLNIKYKTFSRHTDKNYQSLTTSNCVKPRRKSEEKTAETRFLNPSQTSLCEWAVHRSAQSTTPKSLHNNGFILGNVKSAWADKILGSAKNNFGTKTIVWGEARDSKCVILGRRGKESARSQDSCGLPYKNGVGNGEHREPGSPFGPVLSKRAAQFIMCEVQLSVNTLND